MADPESRAINEGPEGEERAVECDLGQVEEILNQTTELLFEGFRDQRIDPTMTVTGLQLVQDAKEACNRGDKDACKTGGADPVLPRASS